jgi:ferredoxin
MSQLPDNLQSAASHYTIEILNTGERFRCTANESLLSGMARMGKKGIPVGCRGGGCGVCAIQIVAGEFSTCAMSRQFISAEDEASGLVLACRVKPRSDIALHVVGVMSKNVCRTTGAGAVMPAPLITDDMATI